MNATDQWITRFTAELEQRDVPETRIRDEVDTVRDHVRTSGADARASFGDPVAYAGTLADPADEDTPSQSTLLAVLVPAVLFIVFVLTGVRWVGGDTGSALWAVTSGAAFVVSLAVLSVALTRRAIAAALRDHLSASTDAQWRVASTLLPLIPWAFVGFAGLILATAALA